MSITLVLIIITAIISIKAFNDHILKQKAVLYPYVIRKENEWHRMLSSGFLHADWIHLLVNMYVLYIFGHQLLEETFVVLFESGGRLIYLGMYISAIVIANIPSYLKHKDNPTYMSLGASGAVSAIVFSYILFYPGNILYLFFALPMPSVVFGALYLLYSVYMSRRGGDNINHDAHFVGAVYGFTFPLVLQPRLFNHFMEQITQLI